MKIIFNNYIPFNGFSMMNILGLVFSRIPESLISEDDKRHETTHTHQQYELCAVSLVVSFALGVATWNWWCLLLIPVIPFAIYILSFILEAVIPPYHNAKAYFENKTFVEKVRAIPSWLGKVWVDAYQDNCFEREAYTNEHDVMYNSRRHLFAWIRYIIPNKERKE
jgi:hypothetical protein